MSSEKLRNKLWEIANQMRGRMDSSDFKNYMLGFIFYKFLSDQITNELSNIKKSDKTEESNNQTISIFWNTKNKEDKLIIENIIFNRLGFYIPQDFLFENIIKKINNGEEIIQDLKLGFDAIESSIIGKASSDDFMGLFDDIDLNNNKIGNDFSERNRFISKILGKINDIEFNEGKDSLGDAYEYLISNFASDAGKKGGEFYTPSQVSEILARITTLNKDEIKSVYDPTCGSGSLLLKINNLVKTSYISGQELNHTTYNLARMNMILHKVKYDRFSIKQGDTIENDLFKDKKFEVIVANPPFGSKWSRDDKFLSDDRFSEYGELPPKGNADYVFLMHMLNHLEDGGIMATVFSNSVLSRGNAEARLREKIIKNKNYLDVVIGLPSNLFFGTSISAIILIFKKKRNNEDILFIDASQEFEKDKNQNKLLEEHITKIVETYSDRKDIEKYSRKISMSEIKENEYNLNISRYIDTSEEEIEIDLNQTTLNLEELNKEQIEIKQKLNKMLNELGLEKL